MKRIRIVVLALMVAACGQAASTDAGPDDFSRGVERGYEMALSDISDCALENGDMEAFQECVGNAAVGMSIILLDESTTEQDQRRSDASSDAFQIWTGILLRL
jgi:hypothetical protein